MEHRGPDCLCGHFVVVVVGCGRRVSRCHCCHLTRCFCFKGNKQNEAHDGKMGSVAWVSRQSDRKMNSFKLGDREGCGALRYCIDNWINGRLDNCSDIDRGIDRQPKSRIQAHLPESEKGQTLDPVSIIPRGSMRGGLSTYTIVSSVPLPPCPSRANCAG